MGLASLFTQVDANIEATFILDGKEYDVEHFFISFDQSVDFKGQPQHETRGGQLSLVLTQAADDIIYDWAMKATLRKDGKIKFLSRTQGTVLEASFMNARCVKLVRSIDAFSGTKSSLTIAPEKVNMNGIVHDNQWRS